MFLFPLKFLQGGAILYTLFCASLFSFDSYKDP